MRTPLNLKTVLVLLALAVPTTSVLVPPAEASIVYVPEGPGTVDEVVGDMSMTMGWCCDWCRSVVERNCPNGGYGRCSMPDSNRCRCTYWCYATSGTTNIVAV